MSILGIAFFTAIGYFIIVWKMIGTVRLKKTQVLWDILFIGTFSGLATAVLAGVMFSLFTSLLPKES